MDFLAQNELNFKHAVEFEEMFKLKPTDLQDLLVIPTFDRIKGLGLVNPLNFECSIERNSRSCLNNRRSRNSADFCEILD